MNDVQALQRAIHDLTDQIQSPVLLTRLYRLAEYLYVNRPSIRRAAQQGEEAIQYGGE